MEFKIYDTLPQEAVLIRETVFVKEQGFCEEFDETDAGSRHLVLFDGNIPVATCRFFKELKDTVYVIGRIAVMKDYRGRGLGADIVKEAERHIRGMGGRKVCLHAQKRVEKFYSGLGYCVYGEEDSDEGCPHVWMEKEL